MSKKIFNIIAILIIAFIVIFLPLKMTYYSEQIEQADKQMQETPLPGSNN